MGEVIIVRRPVVAEITRDDSNVVINRPSAEITLEGPAVPAVFLPFSFVATAGQTLFTLTSTPKTVILLAINGATQRAADYTVSGRNITLTEAVDEGDKVYGVIQIS